MHHSRQLTLRLRRAASAGGLLLISSMLVVGCSVLPEPQADPTRNFVLSAPSAPNGDAPARRELTVQLLPVEVAGYLRTQAIVVRRGAHEIEFREYARWGESLEAGIQRVLREALLAQGAATTVELTRTGGGRADTAPDVQVRILASEGGADGEVYFRAAWEVSVGAGDTSPVRGVYRATGLRWDGTTEAELVARLSEAVAGLASEIGQALK